MQPLKDARSVSWYPYNGSKLLQYVFSILNEFTLQKEIQISETNNVFWTKK